MSKRQIILIIFGQKQTNKLSIGQKVQLLSYRVHTFQLFAALNDFMTIFLFSFSSLLSYYYFRFFTCLPRSLCVLFHHIVYCQSYQCSFLYFNMFFVFCPSVPMSIESAKQPSIRCMYCRSSFFAFFFQFFAYIYSATAVSEQNVSQYDVSK